MSEQASNRPHIHTKKARHEWIENGKPELGAHGVPMLCLRCGQRPCVIDPAAHRRTHATGCAGRPFHGWYRRGDEVEFDLQGVAMWGVLLRRSGLRSVHVRMQPGHVVVVPRSSLRPWMAGPIEAEKRHVEFLREDSVRNADA